MMEKKAGVRDGDTAAPTVVCKWAFPLTLMEREREGDRKVFVIFAQTTSRSSCLSRVASLSCFRIGRCPGSLVPGVTLSLLTPSPQLKHSCKFLIAVHRWTGLIGWRRFAFAFPFSLLRPLEGGVCCRLFPLLLLVEYDTPRY